MSRQGKEAVTVLVVFGVIITLLCIWATSGGDNKTSSTTFSSSMTFGEPVNPAVATVDVLIQNTGKQAGTPECSVHVADASGTYKGSDIFTSKEVLQPGQKSGFHGQVTITNEGAAYITKGTVSCYN